MLGRRQSIGDPSLNTGEHLRDVIEVWLDNYPILLFKQLSHGLLGHCWPFKDAAASQQICNRTNLTKSRLDRLGGFRALGKSNEQWKLPPVILVSPV